MVLIPGAERRELLLGHKSEKRELGSGTPNWGKARGAGALCVKVLKFSLLRVF